MPEQVNQLIGQVDDLARKHSQPDLAARILMPLASLMSLGLIPAHAPVDPNKLKYVEMPEAWLAAAAAASDLSDDGLSYLAHVLQNKKTVMVADAVVWADIERKRATVDAIKTSLQPTHSSMARELSAGGAAILARATRNRDTAKN